MLEQARPWKFCSLDELYDMYPPLRKISERINLLIAEEEAERSSRLRPSSEIGGCKYKEADRMYRTYASMYLDYVDDNYDRHFHDREQDVAPLGEIGKTVEETGDHAVDIYNAYAKASADLAKIIIESWGEPVPPIEVLCRDYPPLKEIVHMFA